MLSVSCAVIMGMALVACKDTQACEQSRIDVAKTWRKVKETAGARALPGGDETLTDAQKSERKKTWGDIQESAYLVEGSFKTTQITWAAADKGRTEIKQQYAAVPGKEDPLVAGFGRMVEEADAEYEAFKQNCR
jgi:hypothetical protein